MRYSDATFVQMAQMAGLVASLIQPSPPAMLGAGEASPTPSAFRTVLFTDSSDIRR